MGVSINAMGVSIAGVSGKKVQSPKNACLAAGVRGDGRCLFRAVAYGHNMQERKGAQDSHQDEHQADLLRNLVRPPPTSSCHFWQLLRFIWKLVLYLDALCGPSYRRCYRLIGPTEADALGYRAHWVPCLVAALFATSTFGVVGKPSIIE